MRFCLYEALVMVRLFVFLVAVVIAIKANGGQVVAAGTPEEIELLNVPIKGLVRRIRFVAEVGGAPIVVDVNFALSQSPFSPGTYDPIAGELDRITWQAALVQPPIDLLADTLDDSQGNAARGNNGIPFELAPSSPGSTTGTLYLAWETSFVQPDTSFQLTIEPLV